MRYSAGGSRRAAAAPGGLIVIVLGAMVLTIIGFAVARAIDPPRTDDAPAGAAAEGVSAHPELDVAAADEQDARIKALESRLDLQAEAIARLTVVVQRLEERLAAIPSGMDARSAREDADAGGFDTPDAALHEPPLAFDPPELDFGDVPLDQELTGSFSVRNVSEQPVRIVAVKSDCKCTTVEDIRGRVIEPGESVELTAVIDARSYPGQKQSQIHFGLADHPEVITYSIRSHTSRPVYLEPSHLDAFETVQGVVTVASQDGEPFEIVATNGSPPEYVSFDPHSDEPRSSYQVRWDLSRYDPQTCVDEQGNKMPNWWVIETDHPEAPLIDARVRHNCTRTEMPREGRRWVLSELRVVLDEIPAGESAEFEVEMEWLRGHTPGDTIQRVESESPQMKAELVEVDRDGQTITARVRITPDEDHRGLLYSDVRFYAYQPQHSAPVTVIARVVDPAEQARTGSRADEYATDAESDSHRDE